MRRTLLLLIGLLLAVPLFAAAHPRHRPHPVAHHAKNAQFPRKRVKNAQFQQARARRRPHRLVQKHPRNPNLPKPRKSRSRKSGHGKPGHGKFRPGKFRPGKRHKL